MGFRNNKKVLYFTIFIVLSIIISGCSNATVTETKKNEIGNKVFNIQTSVYPIQFFTEQIGGSNVNVNTIYSPGDNEHTFEPTQKDIRIIGESDLFFYIGFDLETFIEKAKNTLKNENVTFIPVGENGLGDLFHAGDGHVSHDHSNDEASDHSSHAHEIDPHIWLDPIYSVAIAGEIKNELIKKIPDQSLVFESNFQKLKERLEEIDYELIEMSSSLTSNTFLITHASFGYWEQRYNLNQVSIEGIYSESEVSPQKITSLINLINDYNIGYIFVEQNADNRYVELLQNEVNINTLPIHNLSILTTEDIKNEDDFFTIMQKNIDTFRTALN